MLRFSNGILEVTLVNEPGCLTIRTPGDRPFATCCRFSLGEGGTAAVRPTSHPTFGEGETLTVVLSDNAQGEVALFPGLPFALMRSRVTNTGPDVMVVNKLTTHALQLALGHAPTALKSYGTTGLTAPDGHPGSYAYLAVVEPTSRNGVVGGWLTHDRGSGVVFSSLVGSGLLMEGQVDYGCLRIAPGESAWTETFMVGYFDDARLGLEAYADAIAAYYEVRLPPQPIGYCTWYHAWNSSSEADLALQLPLAAQEFGAFGFSVAQLDDGWQKGEPRNGPAKNFTGTPEGEGRFPHGMKAQVDAIKAEGLVAGLWFMPFAGDHLDPFFSEHPEWFVRRADGNPYETAWGGTSLDMTHPGARAYLQEVTARICREWGFGYLKMDGLWTGTATDQVYVNTGYRDDDGIGTAVFSDPSKTNIEAYRDGLRLVRLAAGDDVFLLGCCVPQNMRSFGGSFGLVDAMRIGPDNGCTWPALKDGPEFGSRSYFLHGRVWYNDPDPIYSRPSMPLAHARLMASWAGVSGQLTVWSEWLPDVPQEYRDILKRAMPSHGLLPRPVDLFEHTPPRAWLLTDERTTARRDVVALFNWDETASDIEFSTERIGLAPDVTYIGFDYWADKVVGPFRGAIRASLPPTSCAVISVRPICGNPQVISTSRHVTQGMVDLASERWNACSASLAGVSRLVAGDPYELRVYTGGGWALLGASASWSLQGGDVSVDWTEEGDLIRVTLDATVSGEVEWSLSFRETV